MTKRVIPRKRVDPSEMLEDALDILNDHLKNMRWKVRTEKGLTGFEVRTIVDTIKSIALLKDTQLKSIQLDQRIKQIELEKLEDASDEEILERVKKLVGEIKND